MLLSKSENARRLFRRSLEQELRTVETSFLRHAVETLSVPRHYLEEPAQNRRARDFVAETLRDLGYDVTFQSACDNIVASNAGDAALPRLLIGAHYDSVPGSPGADDNASAVAALLAVARSLALLDARLPVVFVAFNREEEGLLGSQSFSRHLKSERPFQVREAHVLEMLGFTATTITQRKPALPIRLPERADFLGLIAKARANRTIPALLGTARAHVPELAVLGLRVWFGLDRYFPVLRRSDHAPLWDAGIPAVMWTDTAEFRNPNYHQPTDTPDTLDYAFLTRVTQLLLAHTLLTLEP